MTQENNTRWSYSTWYNENREEINKRRREKYAKNESYRRRSIQESQKYYRKKREEEGFDSDRRVIRRDDERFFSIGRFAGAIGRAEATVREYHLRGIIPPATHRDERHWRLYSPPQVELARDVFSRFDRKELRNLSEVAVVLRKYWRRVEKSEKKGGSS